LLRAYKRRLTSVRVAVLQQRGGAAVDDSYWRHAAAGDRSVPLVVAWGGNGGGNEFLFESAPRFQLMTKGSSSAVLGVPVVPAEMAKARMWANMEPLSQALSVLSGHQLLVLGSPPPKASEWVKGSIDASARLIELGEHLGVDPRVVPIAPISVRVGAWELMQEVLRQRAEEAGGTFVPVPREAVDADGALRAEFCEEDVIHGNADYGALMLETVRRALIAVAA
jgi:hypothetical protein